MQTTYGRCLHLLRVQSASFTSEDWHVLVISLFFALLLEMESRNP